jgi:four helix bundle protein
MARDHRKLRVFHDSHRLVLAIYRETKVFPKDEWFGIRQQMRRAATSVPTNIVEGSARQTTGEYINFVNVARGSAGELQYLIGLACELSFLNSGVFKSLDGQADHVVRQLQRLLQELEILLAREREAKHQPGKIGNSDRKPNARVESREPFNPGHTP